jgi:sodium/hydrogen antiporter
MERGEVTPDEKSERERERDGARTINGSDEGKREDESGEQTVMDSSQELEDRTKAENIPDGTDTVSEWREGNHKVVERRTGPGEEVCNSFSNTILIKLTLFQVEVEVVRDCFAPGDSEEQASSSFRGDRPTVRQSVAAHLDKLTHTPHEIDKTTNKIEENIHKVRRAMAPSASLDEEDEEGWASDHSAASSHREGSAVQPSEIGSDGKKRSKPPKKKPVIKSAPLGKGRRRNSMRRGLFGQVHQIMDRKTQSFSESPTHSRESSVHEGSETEEEDSGRGRRSIMIHDPSTWRPRTADSSGSGTAPSSRPGTARSSIRNLRTDLIRADARSRDESPSRSIRFADEDRPGSGASTPTARHSLFYPGHAITSSHERSHSDDLESGTNRVTFDIPGEGAPKS